MLRSLLSDDIGKSKDFELQFPLNNQNLFHDGVPPTFPTTNPLRTQYRKKRGGGLFDYSET